MKKLVVLILASIYLTTSVGATVHLHFCMNKLVDWGLSHSGKDKCGQCGMEKTESKDKGCCKDEHKQIKLESDHKASVVYALTDVFIAELPLASFEVPAAPLLVADEPINHNNGPPRKPGLAVYIRNCSFLI